MLNVRLGGLADAPALLALHVRESYRPTTLTAVSRALESLPSALALDDDTLVGFCYSRRYNDQILELSDMFVTPACRHRGLGARLLECVEREATPHFNYILIRNAATYPGHRFSRRDATLFARLGYIEAAVLRRRPILLKKLDF